MTDLEGIKGHEMSQHFNPMSCLPLQRHFNIVNFFIGNFFGFMIAIVLGSQNKIVELYGAASIPDQEDNSVSAFGLDTLGVNGNRLLLLNRVLGIQVQHLDSLLTERLTSNKVRDEIKEALQDTLTAAKHDALRGHTRMTCL